MQLSPDFPPVTADLIVPTFTRKGGPAPLETPADTTYGLLRTRLEQAGTRIGANDLLNNDLLNNDLLNNDPLIAAQALTLGCVIVTDNERKFSRVKGLRLQNWLRSTE